MLDPAIIAYVDKLNIGRDPISDKPIAETTPIEGEIWGRTVQLFDGSSLDLRVSPEATIEVYPDNARLGITEPFVRIQASTSALDDSPILVVTVDRVAAMNEPGGLALRAMLDVFVQHQLRVYR